MTYLRWEKFLVDKGVMPWRTSLKGKWKGYKEINLGPQGGFGFGEKNNIPSFYTSIIRIGQQHVYTKKDWDWIEITKYRCFFVNEPPS